MNLARSREHIRDQIDRLCQDYAVIFDDEELRQLAIESETDLREFMIGIVKRMVDAENMADVQATELKNLKERRDRYVHRHEAMRELAFGIMQDADVQKLELPQRTLSIRLGTPKVIITDEHAIPDSYCRIKREPDKPIIKEHLKQGINVPGASLSNAQPVLMVTK